MPAQVALRDDLEKAYTAVMSFPEGVIVLKHILEITGFNDDLKTYDKETRELNIHATLYNLSQRDVWIHIKEYLTPKQQCTLEEEQFVKVKPEQKDNSEDEYDA